MTQFGITGPEKGAGKAVPLSGSQEDLSTYFARLAQIYNDAIRAKDSETVRIRRQTTDPSWRSHELHGERPDYTVYAANRDLADSMREAASSYAATFPGTVAHYLEEQEILQGQSREETLKFVTASPDRAGHLLLLHMAPKEPQPQQVPQCSLVGLPVAS